MVIFTRICAALIMVAWALGVQAQTRDWDIAGQDYEHVFMHDGFERGFWVHLPPGYDGTQDLPVVIALHGGLMDPYGMADYTNLHEKANAENFIAVFPAGLTGVLDPLGAYGEIATGQSFLGLRAWNTGYCCGRPNNGAVDDAEFLRLVAEELSAAYAVDEQRVYLTGLSNGAGLTMVSGLGDGDIFAAIAPVAGGIHAETLQDFPNYALSGDGRTPIAIIHGKQDENRPYQGGTPTRGTTATTSPGTPEFLAVEDIADHFAAANGCTSKSITPASAQTDPGLANVTTIAFSGCDMQTGVPLDVVLYAVDDGGHAWPGADTANVSPFEQPTATPDATDLIWAFFLAHSDFSIAQKSMTFQGRGRVNQAGVRPDLLRALDYAVNSLASSSGLKRLLRGLMDQPNRTFAQGLPGFLPNHIWAAGDGMDLIFSRIDQSLSQGGFIKPDDRLGLMARRDGRASLTMSRTMSAAAPEGAVRWFGGSFSGDATVTLNRAGTSSDARLNGQLAGLRMALSPRNQLTIVATNTRSAFAPFGATQDQLELDALSAGLAYDQAWRDFVISTHLIGLSGTVDAARGSILEIPGAHQSFNVSRTALGVGLARPTLLDAGHVTLTPFARLGGQTTRIGGYDEQGGVTRLRVSNTVLGEIESRIGARLIGHWSTPFVKIGLGVSGEIRQRLVHFGTGPKARLSAAPTSPHFRLPIQWGEARAVALDGALSLSMGAWQAQFDAGTDPYAGAHGGASLRVRW